MRKPGVPCSLSYSIRILHVVFRAPSSTLASQASGFTSAIRRVARRRQTRRFSTRSWFPSAWQTGAKMASGSGGDKKVEKSTWASGFDSINPWAAKIGSRSSTPMPREPAPAPTPAPNQPNPTNSADHAINPIYGLSAKKYPPDCPPLAVQWFHAVDIPKKKPQLLKGKKKPEVTKPEPRPKKFVPFSPEDSLSIESAYQTVLEGTENDRSSTLSSRNYGSQRGRKHLNITATNTSYEAEDEAEYKELRTGTRVPVNEDFLFDVDIEKRELAPVYWLGPIYDVRRGSWFYQEGSNLRPCEENLAAQLEEGYLKCRPWLSPVSAPKPKDVTPKASVDNLKAKAAAQGDGSTKAMGPPLQPQTHRLFGSWMNSVATYQDANTAWLSSDSVLSWVTSTVYERFAAGGYMSGFKLVRGYSEPGKGVKDGKDGKDKKGTATPPGIKSMDETDEKQDNKLKRRSAPPSTRSNSVDNEVTRSSQDDEAEFESRGDRLKRQLSSLIESENQDADEQEEAVRRREEKEIQDDYNAPVGETQGREIEHLVLITHGIGQLLGLRMEAVNFVHDVNTLRKTLKSVYSTSDDLRALNTELGAGPGNCRVQVLPVCWRHLLDFPKKREEKKREQDIGMASDDEDEYPSLDDITVEGVAFARQLISDLALDVLLYQSSYRNQIIKIVFNEANRIHKLFLERNPGFKGKVHVMGHSLGSAIMFDILCRQNERPKDAEQTKNPLRFWPSEQPRPERKDTKDLTFDFDVDDFYCLGSPIGLFQMLEGRTIAARHLLNNPQTEKSFGSDFMDDTFTAPLRVADQRVSPVTGLPYSVSSPKVFQLFNIFHPSDPIAYRVEPLISPAMSELKPQVLPYTKKGIFGSVAPQGITGIGAKVGQSVSGLWSSLSAGLASNLLNRSLGLTQEDVARMSANTQPQHAASPGAGTNIQAGVISTTSDMSQKAAERKKWLAENSNSAADGRKSISGNDMTLLDDDLETLYSKFQKKRVDLTKVDDEKVRDKYLEEEKAATRLRKEENKVLALNRNGRVDYSIQESVLDYNPLNTIASHMSYWSDEDVAHFVMSQLLSNKARKGDENVKSMKSP